MKNIKKGQEPKAWKAYRNTEGVEFSAIPELKYALLEEQGHICCYCMKRISFENMKVEHLQPRIKEDLVFDYNNLMAACLGKDEKFHCDTNKKNTTIIIDPLNFKQNLDKNITYSYSDGSVKYPEIYKEDIETTLNLNNIVLKSNRLKALEAVRTVLLKKNFATAELNRQLEKFKNTNNEGKFEPYCMIVVQFLERKIRAKI